MADCSHLWWVPFYISLNAVQICKKNIIHPTTGRKAKRVVIIASYIWGFKISLEQWWQKPNWTWVVKCNSGNSSGSPVPLLGLPNVLQGLGGEGIFSINFGPSLDPDPNPMQGACSFGAILCCHWLDAFAVGPHWPSPALCKSNGFSRVLLPVNLPQLRFGLGPGTAAAS